jgi:hypothetical protein
MGVTLVSAKFIPLGHFDPGTYYKVYSRPKDRQKKQSSAGHAISVFPL